MIARLALETLQMVHVACGDKHTVNTCSDQEWNGLTSGSHDHLEGGYLFVARRAEACGTEHSAWEGEDGTESICIFNCTTSPNCN